MASSPEIHKGLTNNEGQNNCFLNSAIQTLWHLPAFRGALAAHQVSLGAPSPLLGSLQSLFANYEYGEDCVLPADDVRDVLSNLYAESGHFKLGELEDATECLEAILVNIHCEHVGTSRTNGGEEKVCSPECASCGVFKIKYLDQKTCSTCETTPDSHTNADFIYRVWVQECISVPSTESLALAMKRIWKSDAGARKTTRWCTAQPEVLAISFVWPTLTASQEEIAQLLAKVRPSMAIEDVFSLPDDQKHGGVRYRFAGMICYYGKHYVSMFVRRIKDKSSPKYGHWMVFDDAIIRELESWDEIQSFCIKARYQPTIVWLEKIPQGEDAWWHPAPPRPPTTPPPAPKSQPGTAKGEGKDASEGREGKQEDASLMDSLMNMDVLRDRRGSIARVATPVQQQGSEPGPRARTRTGSIITEIFPNAAEMFPTVTDAMATVFSTLDSDGDETPTPPVPRETKESEPRKTDSFSNMFGMSKRTSDRSSNNGDDSVGSGTFKFVERGFASESAAADGKRSGFDDDDDDDNPVLRRATDYPGVQFPVMDPNGEVQASGSGSSSRRPPRSQQQHHSYHQAQLKKKNRYKKVLVYGMDARTIGMRFVHRNGDVFVAGFDRDERGRLLPPERDGVGRNHRLIAVENQFVSCASVPMVESLIGSIIRRQGSVTITLEKPPGIMNL